MATIYLAWDKTKHNNSNSRDFVHANYHHQPLNNLIFVIRTGPVSEFNDKVTHQISWYNTCMADCKLTESQFHSKTLRKQIAYIEPTTTNTHSQKKQRKVRNQNQTISNLEKMYKYKYAINLEEYFINSLISIEFI